MSSGRRSKRSDPHRHYRDSYEDHSNGGGGVYTRGYAPWQWGYWSSDNMAYAGQDDAFYSIQDDRSRGRGRGHYAGNMYDNAGYHGYKQGISGGGSYKLKPPSSTDGLSEYPGEGSDKSSRRCCVVMAVVGMMFLLGAALAIGIYFGVVDKPESLRDPDVTTTTVAPAPALSVDMSLTIDRTFDPDLYNPDSQTYKDLETEVKEKIDQNMKNSPQGDSYSEVEVLGFSPGSIVASTRLKFAKKTVVENNVEVELTTEKIITTFKDQLDQSNTVLFVKDQITAKISTAVGNVGIGESCTVPSDCSVGNTICTGSPSTCQCDTGFYDSNGNLKKGVCLPKKDIGGTCLDENSCSTVDSECMGTPKVCSCVTGTYHKTDTNACRPKLQNGDTGCVDAPVQCLVPGAACVNGKCDCEAGYQLKNGACTKLIDYEESGCSVDTDCLAPKAICAVGKCQCLPVDYFSTTTKSCEAKKNNGQGCDDKSECLSPNAVCDETCKCADDKYLKGTEGCVPKVTYGGKCAAPTDCVYENSGCILSLCKCDESTYQDVDTESCKPKILYGQTCKSKEQCVTIDVECPEASKTCVCPESKYLDEDKCTEKKGNGVSCGADTECKLGNSKCENVCGCPAGTYVNGGSCSPQVAIGQPCLGNVGECATGNAKCDGTPKTCNCPDNMFLNGDVCSEKTGTGEACQVDAGCSFDNAVCQSLICACPVDRFVNNDAKSCDLKVDNGGNCKGDNNCNFKNAECNKDGKCACPDNTYEEGTECKDKIPYGGPCDTPSKCLTGNVGCIGSTCNCESAFYYNADSNICLEKKDNGLGCKGEVECKVTGAKCLSLVCNCPAGAFLNGDICSPQVAYDGACVGSKPNECSTQNAICDGTPKKCTCSDTQYLNGNMCSDKIGDGQSCSPDDKCTFSDAVCLEGFCTCPLDRFPNNDAESCDLKLEQGETCVGANQCKVLKAECNTDKKCACNEKMYEDGGECKDKIPYNGRCSKANHCLTTDAACTATTCLCETGSYHDTDSDACMKIKEFGEDCTSDMQCPTSSKCTSGKCGCPDGMFEDTDKCSTKKKNKEACMNEGQCLFDNAECDHVCQCPAGRFEDGDSCELQVGNGNTCKGDLLNECLIEGAICSETEKVCECPETKFLSGEKCIEKTGNGQGCKTELECKYGFADCVSEFCTCPEDRYADITTETCELKVGLNEECKGDSACRFDGAKCSLETSKCVCLDNTYVEGEACKERKVYGVECGDVSQCGTGSAICSGIPKICTCDVGLYYDAETDTCLPVKGFGDVCKTDDMCSKNINCINTKCACPTGYYEDNDKCSEKKPNQVVCKKVEECLIIDAECNQVCLCPGGTYEDGLFCKELVAYEVECKMTSACKTKFAECSAATKTCLCPITMFRDIDTDTCRERAGDGGTCENDNGCSFGGAVCTSDNCACPEGKFANTQTNSCDNKRPIDGACTDPSQCVTGNALCDGSKCACSSTTFEKDGQCVDRSPNGGYCSIAGDCLAGNALCKENVCTCADTDYLKDDECLNKKENDKECDGLEECLYGGAVCEATCKCPELYKLMGTTCMKLIPYKSECSDVELCKTTDSICAGDQTNICTCAEGKYYDSNLDSCKPLLEQGEEGCLDAQQQCTTEDAVCLDGKCSCSPGTYYLSGKCNPGKDNGEACGNTEWCKIGGAVCEAICKCEDGYYSDGLACLEKVPFDAPCTQEGMCRTSSGKCVIGKCGCGENYYHDPQTDKCLIKIGYNEACDDSVQCITGNADCNGNLCLCPVGKYLADVSCEDKKGYGEICETTEECDDGGLVCDVIECLCPEGMYYDGICKQRVGLGESCKDKDQCSFTNAECESELCACPAGTYPSGTSCMPVKSHGSSCDTNEECKTQNCVKNKCSCLATQYFDTGSETCTAKVAYNDACSDVGQCSTGSVECTTGKCVCSDNHFFDSDSNSCFIRIGDGGSCTDPSTCATGNAQCLGGTCTCGTDKFLNTFANSCDDKKGNGDPCSEVNECKDGFECNGVCKCPTTMYLSDTTCLPRKENGLTCEDVGQCIVENTGCLEGICNCSVTMFLSNGACITRLNHGLTCEADGNCNEKFVCKDSACSCQDGYMYEEDSSTCIMIVTTTAAPTTLAPDEEVVITTEGKLVSNETFSDDLSDPNSELFIKKKEEIESSLAETLEEGTTGEVVGFEQGSIQIIIKFTVSKDKITIEADIQTDDMQEADQQIATTLLRKMANEVSNLAKKLQEKGVFEDVAVPENSVKIEKKPCLDDVLIAKRAEKDICGSVLRKLQGLANSPSKRCSAYNDMLNCIALQFEFSNTNCPWNNFRTNFEKFILPLLKLEEKTFKPCIKGNFFNFFPIGGKVSVTNPCKDVTAMKMVAKYECSSEYSVIPMVTGRKDLVCSYALSMEACVQTVLIQKFKDQYLSCEAEADVKLSLTLMIDTEQDFFESKKVALEECEFCLPPNVFHIFTTKCGWSMNSMATVSQGEACGMLHQEMQCIETYLKTWSEKHECTMDKLKEMFMTDKRFLEYGQKYLEWLNKENFAECLASEMQYLGPAEHTSICENQNYVYYKLRFSQCFTYIVEATTGGCPSLYQAVECVRTLLEKEDITCQYKVLEKSILKMSTEYKTISSVIEPGGSMGGCIMETAENACQSAIHSIAVTKGEDIIQTCLYNLQSVLYLQEPQFIKPYNSDKGSLVCDVLQQGTLCTYGIFATGIQVCTFRQAYMYIKETLPELVKHMVAAIQDPAEKPGTSVDVFNKCPVDFARAEDFDCKGESAVLTSVTASCAPLVMYVEDKCVTFEGCVDGAKEWHETIPICPGYVESLESGQFNSDMANYFYGVSKFQWMTCFEEAIDHDVAFSFPKDDFNDDYYDLDSPAAKKYIDEKLPLLEWITEGRPVEVNEIAPMGRRKREADENDETGTKISATVKGPRNMPQIMKNRAKDLPASQRNNIDVKLISSKDGSNPGTCPAVESYNKVCSDFLDQCSEDSECSSTQKCCEDGSAYFCVDPVTEAAEYTVELTLKDVTWTEEMANDKEAQENLMRKYSMTLGSLLEDFDHDLQDLRANRENNMNLIYSVHAFENPRSVLEEQLKDINFISLSAITFVSQEYEAKDHCPKNLLVVDNILKCIDEQYTDNRLGYQDFEVCSTVGSLTSCAANKCRNQDVTGCSAEDVQNKIMNEKESILKRIRSHDFETGSVTRIAIMLEKYDRNQCSISADVNPCYERDMIMADMEKCKDHLLSVKANEPLGVDFCSVFDKFSSCVVVKVRARGAQWCGDDQIREQLIRLLALPPYSFAMSSFDEKCRDEEKTLCTFLRLRELSWSQCKPRPYIHEGVCSNEKVKEMFTGFMACVRIYSLKDKNDCSEEDIIEIVKSDRYHLGLIRQGEDITTCLSDETMNTIKSELESRETLCSSSLAMKHFYHDCFDDDCELDLTRIEDTSARCTLLYQQISCIEKEMKNETFVCNIDQLMTTAGGIKDKSFPLTLSKEQLDPCIENMEAEGMMSCEIPLLSRMNGSKECVEHLLPDLSKLSQEQQCKLVSVGGSCLSAVTEKVDATCDSDGTVSALKHIIAATSVAMRQLECKYDDNKPKTFPDCYGDLTTLDLCDTSEVDTLINLVKLQCNPMLEDAEKSHMLLAREYGISEQTLVCRGLDMFVSCGKDSTSKLHLACEMSHVKQAIIDNKGKLDNALTESDVKFCEEDACQKAITARVKKCVPEYIRYELYDKWTCRLYNALYHCVKSGLPENTCTDDKIKEHLFLALYHRHYDNLFTKCEVEDKSPFVCTDIEMLNKLASPVCNSKIYTLRDTCSASNREEAMDCMANVIKLYDNACEETEVEKQAKIALLYQDNNYEDKNIRDCFPDSIKNGFCPLQLATSDCRVCEDTRGSDECGSDLQCEDDAKCCFDGCSRKCTGPAKNPIMLRTAVLLVDELWNDRYYMAENEDTILLKNKYRDILENLMTSLGEKVKTTSPKFNLSMSSETDDTELRFDFASFVPDDEMNSMIGRYFEENAMNIKPLYTEYIKGGEISIELEKEGTCPRFSFELSTGYHQQCCNDFSCNDDKKCCKFSSFQQNCVTPLAGTLANCDDPEVLKAALESCELNLEELTSYECSELYGTKMKCVLAFINKDRTEFTQCIMGDLRLAINSTIPKESNTIAARAKIFDCRLLEVAITVELPRCDKTIPAFTEYQTRLENALAKFDNFEKIQEFCRYQKFRTIGRFYTDQDVYTIENNINEDLNTIARRKRESDDNNFLKADIRVTNVDQKGIYWCNSEELSKNFGLTCLTDAASWSNQEYRKCGFVFDFFECVKNKFRKIQNRDTYYDCEMSDNMLKEIVIPYIETEMEDMDVNQKNLDKLKMYNSDKCPDYDTDVNPCFDDDMREEAYNQCQSQFPFPNMLDISDSKNCRKFYDLSFCMATKLRDNGARCSFQDIDEHLMNKLMDDRTEVSNGPRYFNDWICAEHKPVCSANNIIDSVHGDCMRHDYYAGPFNCSDEKGKMKFRKLVSCLAIDGLFKKEVDCTVSRIMEMIKMDKYNLGLINSTTGIDMCLSDDEKSNLELELKLGENLCSSGTFLQYIASNCLKRNDNGDVEHRCSYRDDEDSDDSTASCSYLRQVMSCAKKNISESVGVECRLVDLVSTDISVDNMPEISSYAKEMCVDKLENSKCIQDDLTENYHAALRCVKAANFSSSIFLEDDLPGEDARLCRILDYSLTCLKSLISETCTDFDENDLYMEFTSLMEYLELDRSMRECVDYKMPATFQTCKASSSVLSTENDCQNADFVTDVVIGYCGRQFRSLNIGENKCLGYPGLLSCGIEGTKMFLTSEDDMGKDMMGCERDQIISALQSKSERVAVFLSLNPNDCQGDCYEDIEPVLVKCINMTLGLSSRMNLTYNSWRNSCRAYKYMYQCVDLEKPGCDMNLKKTALDTAINRHDSEGLYRNCKDPSSLAKLDMCKNMTDLMEVSAGQCGRYIHALLNTTASLQSPGKCLNQTDLTSCMKHFLEAYMEQEQPEQDICGEETDSVIGRAAMIYIRNRFRYDTGDMEMNLETLKTCFGFTDREGHCPYIDITSSYSEGPVTCAIDDDCKDSEHKCCFDGPTFTCRPPTTIKEKFAVALQLLNVEWKEEYYSMDDQETKSMIAQHLQWIEEICEENGWSCGEYYLSPNKNKRRKRQTEQFSWTNLNFEVQSVNNPLRIFRRAIQMEGKENVYKASSFLIYRESPGICPPHNYNSCTTNDNRQYCGNDQSCRARLGAGYKCCDDCGNYCTKIGDPDVCYPIYSQVKVSCADEWKHDFSDISTDGQWTVAQCRNLDSIAHCLTGKDSEKKCSFMYFKEQAFNDIVMSMDNNYDYNFPKSCTEDEGPTYCEDTDTVYKSVVGKCVGMIYKIFNAEELSLEKCGVYKEFKDCIKEDLSTCDQWSLDNLIDDRIYEIFNRLKEDGKLDDEYEPLDADTCKSNVCWSDVHVLNATMVNCMGDLKALSGVSSMSTDDCMKVFSLTKCITDAIYQRLLHKCDREDIETVFEKVRNSERFQMLAKNNSLDLSQLDIKMCEAKVCHPKQLTRFAETNCSKAFEAYMKDGHCFHVEMFAGCAKFQRLFSKESCTIKEIIFVLKKWGGEIIKKLDEDETLENPDDRKFESCAGDEELETFENNFPKSSDDICLYYGVNHYNLRYNCLSNVNSTFLKNDEQCIYKEYSTGCLHESMKDFGCTFDDAKTAIANPQVLMGMFSNNLDCDAVLDGLNDCDKHILYIGRGPTEHCLMPITGFTNYRVYGLGINVDEQKTVNEDKLLKCSLLEDAAACFEKKTPYTGSGVCNAASFKKIINYEVRLYQEVVKRTLSPDGEENFEPVDFDECPIPDDLDINFGECPEDHVIADLLVSVCAPRFMVVQLLYPQTSTCIYSFAVTECYENSHIARLEKCSNERKKNALMTYDDYMSSLSNGFSFEKCFGYTSCLEKFSQNTDCLYKYISLHLIADQMTASQKCTMLTYYREQTIKCYGERIPTCGKHANEYLSAFVDTRDEIMKTFPNREQCKQTYGVGLGLPKEPYNDDYADVNSDAFKNLITRVEAMLNELFKENGYDYQVAGASKIAPDRKKRQADPDGNNEEIMTLLHLLVTSSGNPAQNIREILDNNPNLQEAFQFMSSQLQESSIDLCDVKEQLGLMECGWEMRNQEDLNCRLRECFAGLKLPEECKDEDRQDLAERVILQTYGYTIGSCEEFSPSPCGVNYFHTASTDTCEESWSAYMETKECKEYKDFVSCIGFMAVSRGEFCEPLSIHKNIAEDVQKYNLSQETTCIDSLQGLKVAYSKEDICMNGLSNAYLLKYFCLNDEYFTTVNTEQRCMMEIKMQHCMFTLTSHLAACHNFTKTTEAFKSEEVQNILNNPEHQCELTCQRYMMLNIGAAIKKTCLHNPRSILYLSDLPDIPVYGDQDHSFPCMVYLDAAYCSHMVYEDMLTGGQYCKEGEFSDVLKQNLPDLIEIMVKDGQLMGMPEPSNSVKEIYPQCNDKIFPLPEPGNCLDGDQMVNTLTASCAVYAEGSLGGATSFSDKCRALSSCVDGIIDWYKMHPVCPGYIEAFMQNQKNPAYAEHFKNITGLDWLKCDTDEEDDKERLGTCPDIIEDNDCKSQCEMDSDCLGQICCENSCNVGKCVDPTDSNKLINKVYRVIFELLQKAFNEDYKDMKSDASRKLIEELTPLLNQIFMGKAWMIERFFSTLDAQRRKRQLPDGPGNTLVEVSVKSHEDIDTVVREAFARDETLSETLSFRSSKSEVDCSATSCLRVECDRHEESYTPDDACCPQCRPVPSPCTPEYFERATGEKCNPIWMKYTQSKGCSDYAAFVSCIWYQAFARNISCDLTQANAAVRDKTLDNQLPAEFCKTEAEGFTFEIVENALPKTRQGVCENVFINRILLFYYCRDTEQYDAIDTPREKCFMEFGIRKCVNDIVYTDFECDITSTNNIFQNEQLRDGLVISKPELDCDATYACAKYLMTDASEQLNEGCIGLASNVLHLENTPDLLMGTEPFKCLTYKYTVECVNKDLKSDEEFSDTCSTGDIHAPLFGLINMDTTSDEERVPFHKVDIFSECIDTLTIGELGDCPEQGEELITIVTAACASDVNEAMDRDYSLASGCRALHECHRGISEWYKMRSMCVDSETSIEERLQINSESEDFITVFESATSLDTGLCKADKTFKTYEVTLLLPDRVYQEGFEDMSSVASSTFMDEIRPLLEKLFGGRKFTIMKLLHRLRDKRQDDQTGTDNNGVIILTEVSAMELSRPLLEEIAKSIEDEVVEILSIYPIYWPCSDDDTVYNCFRDPCDGKVCEKYQDARCVSNYCNGCNAFFFDNNGKDVTEMCTVEVRPGHCPSFEKDEVSTCQVECSTDDDCHDNEKCCNAPCGPGQCIAPVWKYRVSLELIDIPFQESYRDVNSDAYKVLILNMEPVLNKILNIDGVRYRIIGFSPIETDRVRRQTEPDSVNTRLDMVVEAAENPEEMIRDNIMNDVNLSGKFRLLESVVEDECAGVNCDEPDCDRSQWYRPEGECCDQCRKEKPGHCPSFEKDELSTCQVECYADDGCHDNKKCCNAPCGMGQCLAPVWMYKIDLELLGKTFMPDYRNESSDAYKTLVMELEPMLDDIVNIDGVSYRIVGFSPMEPDRVRRQTEPGNANTILHMVVEAEEDPEKMIHANIDNDANLKEKFRLLGYVDECALVDCMDLTCTNKFTPDGECCPMCGENCTEVTCEDMSECPRELISRRPGACCDECGPVCSCEEPKCENPQIEDSECGCAVCKDCSKILEIGWTTAFRNVASEESEAGRCRIFVNTTIMVMDRTMGKFGIEHVNECLLTKLRETQQAVTDSLGPCIGEYYRLIKMSLVLNYEYNNNHSNPESKEFLDRKFSLRHLIKTSVKEVQATDNMFVLVKEFMPAVIENNPEKEFIKANVELLVSLPNDQTTLFEWTKLHGELVAQEEILKVDLIEDSHADEPDDGEDRLPTTTTKPVPLR